jgi:hypothetical protein
VMRRERRHSPRRSASEVSRSLAAAELHRRDLRPASQLEGRTSSPPRTKLPASGTAAPNPGMARITQTKVNAIRAALKAGVKPNTVARELGVSPAAIREVLAEFRKK